MSKEKPISEQPDVVQERMFKRNRCVQEAKQDVIAAYEQLAEAEIEAATISADPTSTPLERAEAETTVDIRLNRIADWMRLLRNRLEERAAFAAEFGIEQTRE